MKKNILTLVLCICVVISSFNLGAFALGSDNDIQLFEYGQAIVKLKDSKTDFVFADNSSYTIDKLWNLDGQSVCSDDITPSYNAFLVKSDELSTEQLIEKMQSLDEVEYAEPNYICCATASVNDARYSEQWGLKNNGTVSGYKQGVDINIEALWDKGITGDDKYVVAVVDSGVDYNHEDLKDNMWHNTYQNQGLEGEYGYDFRNNDSDPMDDYYHGTHCAGILGAVGNNGIGISGVAQNVSIMAVKFLNNRGSGSVSDAISAYEYLIRAKKLGVNLVAINNSWGESGESEGSKALNEMITAIGEMGVLSVCSSGNNGRDNDTNTYIPSSIDNDYIISVGNISYNGQMHAKSNYGKKTVDIMAPGTSILSTMPNNNYTTKTGTSMATPMITGCVVLANQYFNNSLTPTQVKEKLISAVNTSESSLIDKSVSGGFFDAGKILNNKELSYIAVTKKPDKTVYCVGESLDLTGLEVSANYTDGTTKKITDYSVSGFDSSKAGNNTLTVSYEGKNTTFDITIKNYDEEKELSVIEITKKPDKTVYYVGEGLDLTGLEVKANYTDGTSESITEYNVSGFDSSTEGKKNIEISYMGKKATFEIEVIKKQEIKDGWVNTNGMWQYYKDGKFLTDWQSNIPGWSGQYFYFDKLTGFAKSAWAKDIPGWEGQWFYFNPNTYVMMKGWVNDGGVRFFYLDENTGVMKKGWQFLNWSGGTDWFYFDENGSCLTNTTTPDGYVVDENGRCI